MASERVELRDVLTPGERAEIDGVAAQHRGVEGLPGLAEFLRNRFSVELALDPDIIVGYAVDSSNLPGSAVGLCRPCSERECAVVFRTCTSARLPLRVSAGRSNLTGSATPEGGVVVSTERMIKPTVRVDEAACTVRAPVGMILEDMRNAVLEQTSGRLHFPVNPTSRTDCAVGGAIACNASGFTPGEIGSMRAWVASLDVVLPDGSALSADRGQFVSREGEFVLAYGEEQRVLPVPRYPRSRIKNASGPWSCPDGAMDLVDLFIGSEGIFGMVTACTLKLEARPAGYLDLFFSLPDEANAVTLLDHLRSHLPGGVESLAALEYFGTDCRKYMDHEERLFHGNDRVAVYIQVPLAEQAVEDAAEDWLGILSESGCGVEEDAILMLDNEHDRKVFMEARHSLPANSLEVVQHRGTFTIMTDAVVPPEQFAGFLETANSLIVTEGMDYLSFGHLGDCHLHFMILPTREQLERGAEVYDRIIAEAVKRGGVYSGEHGTGKRKRADFLRSFGEQAAEEVRKAKRAVDPKWLLNRGNVVEC